MSETAPSRFWIIRKPDAQGAIVARFDTAGETRLDDRIVEHDDFIIQSVPDRSALLDHEIDRSGLTEEERKILGYR